jgi:glycosyltransferase involved in cell wall biosynthesis
MEDFGLVSIITPLFNCGPFVAETIKSVLAQTYTNWEMLIVDDCSTDNGVIVAKSFHDSRIKIFKNKTNCGAAYSRNIGLMSARGKWIAFLDSDDLWLPSKLEMQLKFMIRNNHSFSYTKYVEISENGKPLNILVSGPKKINSQVMHHICYPGCLTVMYETSVIGKIEVPPEIKKRNDDAILLQAVKKADCFLLNESLSCYRVRNGSISHSGRLKLLSYHYNVYRKIEHKSIFASWLCALKNAFFYFWKKCFYIKRED